MHLLSHTARKAQWPQNPSTRSPSMRTLLSSVGASSSSSSSSFPHRLGGRERAPPQRHQRAHAFADAKPSGAADVVLLLRIVLLLSPPLPSPSTAFPSALCPVAVSLCARSVIRCIVRSRTYCFVDPTNRTHSQLSSSRGIVVCFVVWSDSSCYRHLTVCGWSL